MEKISGPAVSPGGGDGNRSNGYLHKTLERISVNPLVEESISSTTVNPAWDRFPTPLSIIRPASL